MDGDIGILTRIVGLHVGQLDEAEMAAFNRCCHKGYAKRDYSGPAGVFGVAKVAWGPEFEDAAAS